MVSAIIMPRGSSATGGTRAVSRLACSHEQSCRCSRSGAWDRLHHRPALPSETRKAIKKGDDFPNFPFYDTFTQLALAPVQVALLAHMASWVIEQNADLLREKLASESA